MSKILKTLKEPLNLQLFGKDNPNPPEEKKEDGKPEPKKEEGGKNPVELNKAQDSNVPTQDKSLEQEVAEEKDRKYLAKQIVESNERLDKIENMLSQLLSKNGSANKFTSANLSAGNDEDEVPEGMIQVERLY